MSKKVWLITGANSGVGFAIARAALAHGDRVVVTVRSLAKFPDDELRGAKPVIVDFNSPDDVMHKAAEEALAVYGQVDVLVNNAGYGISGSVEETAIDEIRAQFQVNLFGMLAFMQPFITHFRVRQAGHVFTVSSLVAFEGQGSFGAYCASKAAVELFSESLSAELAPYGVRVIILQPGYFATQFFSAALLAGGGRQSAVYTLPSQGFGAMERVPWEHARSGQIGDCAKLAERVHEFAHGLGLAAGRVEGQGGKREWTRLPLGPDCAAFLLRKIASVIENIHALEPIWSSTDVEPERLKYFVEG